MDKFTIQREDLDSMAEAGLSDEEIGITMLAMARYCMDGEEQDLSGNPLARAAFAMLRKRLDRYVKKCETNAANGQTGGRPPKTRPEPETGEPKPNENPTETQPKPNDNPTGTYDYEYEQDEEKAECGSVAPEDETHTEEQQQGTRGRAREGWFDPENPSKGDDGAWRYSEQARKAVAQRILSHTAPTLWDQRRYTDAGILGTELFAALETAMREGIPPGDLVKMARGCIATWVWEAAVKEAVITQGGTANYPEWVAQLDEIREELQQIRGERLTAAYG